MMDLVNHLAMKCNDMSFIDFTKDQYNKSIIFAKRKIAKLYDLGTRLYKTTNTNKNGFVVNIKNISTIDKVVVNNIIFSKVDNITGTNQYMITESNNKKVITYSPCLFAIENELFVESNEDSIFIFYTAIPNIDDDDDEYIDLVPDKYLEEIIKFSIIELCENGLAKFSGEKLKKYQLLFQIYSGKGQLDRTLMNNDRSWINIKPYSVI